MDITSISSALASIKAAKDIAQSMVGLRDTATLQGKVIEFQSKILDAQSAASTAQEERAALIDRVRALEAEVAQSKQWEAEKQNYELKRLGNGFACLLKAEASRTGLPHALCPTCFDKGKKTVLQPNGAQRIDQHSWDCPTCKTSVKATRSALGDNRT